MSQQQLPSEKNVGRRQTFGDKACHPESFALLEGKLREGSSSLDAEILRCAQDDSQDTTQVRSSLLSKCLGRRWFLQQTLILPVAALIAACAGPENTTGSAGQAAASPQASTGAQSTALTSTSGCSGTPTPSQTEGPFYKPGSPERTSLREPGLAGTPLTVTGYVFSTACRPIAHAWLDFWHADSNGNYDNAGFKLRGHQFTDNQGRYHLETIVPGEYPGRTRHIHVKAQAPGQAVLTTQLYFPGESRNTSDSIFAPDLLMQVQSTPNGQLATFNFVLAIQ